MKEYSSGGIPIGFDDDNEYLGSLAGKFARLLMAVPSEVSGLANINNFRYITLRFLLGCRDLSLISIWNPTFLVLLLEALPEWIPVLLRDINDGTINPPENIEPDIKRSLESYREHVARKGSETVSKPVTSIFETGAAMNRGESKQTGAKIAEASWQIFKTVLYGIPVVTRNIGRRIQMDPSARFNQWAQERLREWLK